MAEGGTRRAERDATTDWMENWRKLQPKIISERTQGRMRALLVLVLVGCALVGANLVGLSYTDYASNAIVSLSPANASVISQSLGFNSQWLYALSSTIDLTSGTYYLYTMNATGAYQYAVPLASLSSYSTRSLAVWSEGPRAMSL